MVNKRRASGIGKGIKTGDGERMVSDVLKDAGGKVVARTSEVSGMCSGESGSRKRQHSESGREEGGAGHPVLRSSKRLKKDESPPPEHKKELDSEETDKGPNSGAVIDTPVRGKKKCQKRTWESWNQDDKDAFFEALYEYGKDFESIQAHIASKHKKRGDPPSLTKNKDQVRHLYYRTWNKISKFLDISEDVKKAVQELYGLINYGELRKKIGRLDEKNGHKLNELIKYGVTTVRVKGKNVRIKTPVCRALKRLNNIDDDEDKRPEKLPPRVQLELLPHSNQAWAVIQGLAQNPRVRLNIPLHRRVSSLLEFLQVKWTPHRLKILQELSASEDTKLQLSILPPPGAIINPIPVTGKVVHSKNFCYIPEPAKSTKPLVITNAILSAKGKSVNNRTSQPESTGKSCTSDAAGAIQDCSRTCATRCFNDEDSQSNTASTEDPPTLGTSSQGRDNVVDNCATPCQCNTEEEGSRSRKTAVGETCPVPESTHLDGESVSSTDQADGRTELSGQSKQTNGIDASSVNSNDAHEEKNVAGVKERDATGKVVDRTEECPANESPPKSSYPSASTQTVLQDGQPDSVQGEVGGKDAAGTDRQLDLAVREGWTLQTAGMLTFAELYVMLGKPSKLQLEYNWVQEKIPDVDDASAVWKIIRLAAFELDLLNNKQKNVSVGTSPMKMTPTSPPGGPVGPPPAAGSPSVSRMGVRKPQSPPNNKTLLPAATSTPVRRDSAGFIMPTNVAPARSRAAGQLTQADREFRAQLDSLNKRPDIFLPRKTRGRGGRKPIVVQRTLLPRPSQPSRHMMSLSFIHNSHAAIQGSFTPILPRKIIPPPAAATSRLIAPKTAAHAVTAGQSLSAPAGGAISLAAQAAGVPGAQIRPSALVSTKPLSSVDPSPVPIQTQSPVQTYAPGSPGHLLTPAHTPPPVHTLSAQPQVLSEPAPLSTKPCTSPHPPDVALPLVELPGAKSADTPEGGVPGMDILPDQGGGLSAPGMTDSILDMAITDGMPGTLASPSREGLEIPVISPNTSPSKLCLESVLLNGEAGDITLSSLLATLQSPEKAKNMTLGGNSVLFSEESRDSLASKHALDVDTALHAMMNENSVDYIAKFSELAAQVAGCATSSTSRSADNDTEALGFSCLASAEVDINDKR